MITELFFFWGDRHHFVKAYYLLAWSWILFANFFHSGFFINIHKWIWNAVFCYFSLAIYVFINMNLKVFFFSFAMQNLHVIRVNYFLRACLLLLVKPNVCIVRSKCLTVCPVSSVDIGIQLHFLFHLGWDIIENNHLIIVKFTWIVLRKMIF